MRFKKLSTFVLKVSYGPETQGLYVEILEV